MTRHEYQLLLVLRQYCLQSGTFNLQSGATSSLYVNIKKITLSSTLCNHLGHAFYQYIRNHNVHAIGGPATGAIPLITAIIHKAAQTNYHLEGFFVRPQKKLHGTQETIEGNLQPNQRVVLVDNVATTGNSLVNLALQLSALPVEITQVLVLVDRLAGARQLLHAHNITNYHALFTINDLQPPTSNLQPPTSNLQPPTSNPNQ